MRLLLDTHSFLWFIGGNEQLPQAAREIIIRMDNEVLLSIASLWEIAIKTSLGRLILGRPFEELIPEQIILNEIGILPIGLDDLSTVIKLPFHHRDPFDRLIIAQAMTKGLPIMGNDAQFARYPVELVWHSHKPFINEKNWGETR
ncbi:MAG: type II toxin-antitoxin system VapC family toxin [Desulfomonilaceae bacterium]|nr:type II toxin-antitoxin system VapC family toxin [Desulfomonilaceae bacterium]